MTLEVLNRRIKTTSDLADIVGTMKMLSSVSVGQYEKALQSLTQYSHTIRDAFHGLFTQETFQCPVPQAFKGSPKILAIIVGSDTGLVGRFNKDLMDFTIEHIKTKYNEAELRVIAIGKKIGQLAHIQNLKIEHSYPISNSLKEIAPMAAQLVTQIHQVVSHHKIDIVCLFSNKKQGSSPFVACKHQIIPLSEDQLNDLSRKKWDGRSLPLITADQQELFSALVREYLIVVLSHALVASLASEHYTRMIHMQEAEQNIQKSLEEFNLEYQQLRQTQITDELIDIVSGAEEMNKQKIQSPLDFSKKKK